MPRTTSSGTEVSYPRVGAIIAAFSFLIIAVLAIFVYVLSFVWTGQVSPTADDITTPKTLSDEYWIYTFVIIGIAAMCILFITLFLYCCIKWSINRKLKKLNRLPRNVAYSMTHTQKSSVGHESDIDNSLNLDTVLEEQLKGPFSDNILKFLAGIIPDENRLEFFHKLYADQTLNDGKTVASIVVEVENDNISAKIPERNFHHLKVWIEKIGTKSQLSCIKDSLRDMQQYKVIAQLECYLRDSSWGNKHFETNNVLRRHERNVSEDEFDESKKRIEESDNVIPPKVIKCSNKKKPHYKKRETNTKAQVQNTNKLGQGITKCSEDSRRFSVAKKSTDQSFNSEEGQKNKRRKIDSEKFNQNTVQTHLAEPHLKIRGNNLESHIDPNNSIDKIITTRNAQQCNSGSLMYVQSEKANANINVCTQLMDNTQGVNKGASPLPEYYDQEHHTNPPFYQYFQPEHVNRLSLNMTGKHQEPYVDSGNSSCTPTYNQNAIKSSTESFLSVISGGRNEQSMLTSSSQFENSEPSPTETYDRHDHPRQKSKVSHIVDMNESTVSSFEYAVSSDSRRRKNRTKEANKDNPVERPLLSPLRNEEKCKISNSYSDISCKSAPANSALSCSSVHSYRRHQQVNSCNPLKTEKLAPFMEGNNAIEYSKCVGLTESSTDSSFEYAESENPTQRKTKKSQTDHRTDMRKYSFVKDGDETGKMREKSRKSQKDDWLKNRTDSSSEEGRETDFTRKKREVFKEFPVFSGKSTKSRKRVNSTVRPKICAQYSPRGDSTHSNVLYFMKKWMQSGGAMLEKDYIYFMFHTVKQIMECTEKCEEKILAMTCKDFENCHEIVSKSGQTIYILDSEDGFLPPLGVEEWECLKLHKQQRDIVCQEQISKNTKFVESVYVFIGFDGQPIREETSVIEDQNVEGNIDELSMTQIENN